MDNMEVQNQEVQAENAANAPQPKHGFAVASLVLGILSIVLCCCSYAGIICGILGLIFSILAKKEGNTEGINKAGLVLSIIGVAIFVILIVIGLIIGNAIDWQELADKIKSNQ